MAGRDSWVERQQRLVRCKIHGLHYDPKLTSGCTICRKQAQPRRRSPQLAILLLLLLGIVFVFLQLLTPWLQPPSVEAGFPAAQTQAGIAESRAPSRPPRLDPEAFRPAIEALEAALFRPQTAGLAEIRDQVATAGLRLSQDLQRTGSDAGAAAATSIGSLVERWRGSLASLQDVEPARSLWIESRDRLFEEAPWFSHLTSSDQQVDRIALLAYRDVAADAEALIAEGLTQIQTESDSGAPLVETPGDREVRLAAARQWWADWRRRVAELPARLPARPGAQASAQVLTVVAQLEQALERLRQISADPGLVGRTDATTLLGDLISAMSLTTRELDDLLTP